MNKNLGIFAIVVIVVFVTAMVVLPRIMTPGDMDAPAARDNEAVSAGAPADDPGMTAEARLQRLEDREAIRQLLIEYGQDLDKEDIESYSNLFASDGVWEGGIGSARGPGEIRDMLEKVFARIPPGKYGNSFHIMSSMVIEVDGDTATSWSRWTWFVEGENGKPVPQRAGHYEDILVKEEGRWKFKHRLTVTELPSATKDAESQIFRKDYRDDTSGFDRK